MTESSEKMPPYPDIWSSYLVPGNGENAGFYTICPRASGGLERPKTPCFDAGEGLRFAYTSFWASYDPVHVYRNVTSLIVIMRALIL